MLYVMLFNMILWAQTASKSKGSGGGAAGAIIVSLLISCGIPFLVFLVTVAGAWKVFSKAGEPGWAALVPIYNNMVAGRISGLGEMHGLLTLIPCVGIYFAFTLAI